MTKGRRSGFRICAERCDQCLFSKNKIVPASRKKEIIKETQRDQAFFVCHKASLRDESDVCCRGYFDSYGYNIQLYQIASRLNHTSSYQYIIFVDTEGNEVPQPDNLPAWAGNV